MAARAAIDRPGLTVLSEPPPIIGECNVQTDGCDHCSCRRVHIERAARQGSGAFLGRSHDVVSATGTTCTRQPRRWPIGFRHARRSSGKVGTDRRCSSKRPAKRKAARGAAGQGPQGKGKSTRSREKESVVPMVSDHSDHRYLRSSRTPCPDAFIPCTLLGGQK
jgi:hypothetical protein